ncbi:MAG: Asp-tRNA(Asn)/Glu-tRNA(Gln) amidotransferase subunit GatC [Atopobiaceae bacterium]|nr:Asp-tRNA(Asn)/Glu-tRNA(Gln) amidotransferase subunit GatC [Atopobiaceae bacterium]
MALTTNDVRGIADYARIALTDEELQEMTSYLNDAIELLEPIRAYDLTGVEPTYHPIGDLSNVMSDDQTDANGRSLTLDVALRNAKSTQGRAFRVPSILGNEDQKWPKGA